MGHTYFYLVALVCLLTGCTMRQAGYTAVGAGAGAGIGYSIHHDTKDAVIGGLGGALAGNVLGQWQDKSEKVKHNKAYEEGYKQAKLDVAVQNWNNNTGKDSSQKHEDISIVVPKSEENNVIYDSHPVKVEDN